MSVDYTQFDQMLDTFVRIVNDELRPFMEGDDGTTFELPDGTIRDSAAKALAAMQLQVNQAVDNAEDRVDTFVANAQNDLTAYILPESRDLGTDYTLGQQDQNVVFNCTAGLTVTLPDTIPNGAWVTVVQATEDGTVAFVAGEDTTTVLAAPFVPETRTLWSAVTAQRVGNQWVISGDCTDVATA